MRSGLDLVVIDEVRGFKVGHPAIAGETLDQAVSAVVVVVDRAWIPVVAGGDIGNRLAAREVRLQVVQTRVVPLQLIAAIEVGVGTLIAVGFAVKTDAGVDAQAPIEQLRHPIGRNVGVVFVQILQRKARIGVRFWPSAMGDRTCSDAVGVWNSPTVNL